MTLAEILDAERVRLGLSVYRVAHAAGLAQPGVHRVLSGETANPTIGTVSRMLTALGRDLAWLQEQLDAAPVG